MNIEDELQAIGLTEYESRVLVSAIRMEKASAKSLSEDSQVPYSRIYDTLSDLVEGGWMLKTSHRPALFYVANIEERLDIQVARQKRRIDDLKGAFKAIASEKDTILTPTISVGYGWNRFLDRVEVYMGHTQQLAGVIGFSNISALEAIVSHRSKRFFSATLFVKQPLLSDARFLAFIHTITGQFNVRTLPFTPPIWLLFFDNKDILIALPTSSAACDGCEIKFLEMQNFEMGFMLDKAMELAFKETSALLDEGEEQEGDTKDN